MPKFTFEFNVMGAILRTKPYEAPSLGQAQERALKEHEIVTERDISLVEVEEGTAGANTYHRRSDGIFRNSSGQKYSMV